MNIKYICPQWGSKDLDIEVFVRKAKVAGYDGIEMSLPLEAAERDAIVDTIRKYEMLFVAQHWETVNTDFEAHKEEYKQRITNLASTKPLLINSQTGRDFFSFDQNAEIIGIATEISKEYDVKIVHETHRGKFSFAAHVMGEFMRKMPDLRIGFDVSHWCNVAETFLEDQQEVVDLAISRADHIHSRVGFPEGPQIPDPRVPEWQEAVDIHIGWWERIIERNRKEGKEIFTITSEFGPYPYMTIMPFTQQPITDQWEINVYMMNMLRSKFEGN